MNRHLGHICAHVGSFEPGEPLEDGQMSEMTLPSTHMIQNLNSGGLRPSNLFLGHEGSPQYSVLRVDGEGTFLFLSNCRDQETNSEL